MSVTGYFESIINTWDNLPKHTNGNIQDMRTVLRQFDISVRDNEIDKDKMDYLCKEFTRIRKEVY